MRCTQSSFLYNHLDMFDLYMVVDKPFDLFLLNANSAERWILNYTVQCYAQAVYDGYKKEKSGDEILVSI